MKTHRGHEQAVERHFYQWSDERSSQVEGIVAGLLLKVQDRPGELLGVAVFDSEASYRRNAADPAQDRWYRQLRDHLEADPEWNDGEVVLVAEGRLSATA